MKDCIFCRIVARELPATIIHEDDEVVAFRDLNPQAPVHVLVVPRRHVASLDDAAPGDRAMLGGLLLAVKQIAANERIAGAYRVVHNCGAAAGQSVFHAHFHLLGGRAMGWPPG